MPKRRNRSTGHPRKPGRRETEGERLTLAICHEIGNLQAAIRLSAHLLGRDLGSNADGAFAREIDALAAQAGLLLSQIRPLLSRDAPRVRVQVPRVIEGLRRALDQHDRERIQLEMGLPARALPEVSVDPDALHHALLLWIEGAGEPQRARRRLRITAQRRNAGVAIAVEERRGPVSGSKRTPPPKTSHGRDLALEIARQIIRRQGGELRLRERGGTTRVELWVPAAHDGTASSRRAGGRSRSARAAAGTRRRTARSG